MTQGAVVLVREVADQLSRLVAPEMSVEELHRCRRCYVAMYGAPPSDAAVPTVEQLTALQALLAPSKG